MTHYCTRLQQWPGKPTQRQQDVCGTLWKDGTKTPSRLEVTMETSEDRIFALNKALLHLLKAAGPSRDWWLLLCRNEMERGSVVKGSRGYKKRWTCQRRSEGYLWPPPPYRWRGVRRGCLLAEGWEWGKKGGRGFKMDLCKRRRLQCERSVVHSGKSLSHALSFELQHHAKRQ